QQLKVIRARDQHRTPLQRYKEHGGPEQLGLPVRVSRQVESQFVRLRVGGLNLTYQVIEPCHVFGAGALGEQPPELTIRLEASEGTQDHEQSEENDDRIETGTDLEPQIHDPEVVDGEHEEYDSVEENAFGRGLQQLEKSAHQFAD